MDGHRLVDTNRTSNLVFGQILCFISMYCLLKRYILWHLWMTKSNLLLLYTVKHFDCCLPFVVVITRWSELFHFVGFLLAVLPCECTISHIYTEEQRSEDPLPLRDRKANTDMPTSTALNSYMTWSLVIFSSLIQVDKFGEK